MPGTPVAPYEVIRALGHLGRFTRTDVALLDDPKMHARSLGGEEPAREGHVIVADP
jgi:hypothetical protein